MMRKMHLTLDTETKQTEIKNTINCFVEDMLNGYDKWMYIVRDEDTRRKIVEKGYKQAEAFLESQ